MDTQRSSWQEEVKNHWALVLLWGGVSCRGKKDVAHFDRSPLKWRRGENTVAAGNRPNMYKYVRTGEITGVTFSSEGNIPAATKG